MALFGILGNALNLVVLTRKSLRYTMDHLEKSAHTSLIALAVSDALICVVYIVKSAMSGRLTMFYSRHQSMFPLYFDMYREGLFNVLLLFQIITVTSIIRHCSCLYRAKTLWLPGRVQKHTII